MSIDDLRIGHSNMIGATELTAHVDNEIVESERGQSVVIPSAATDHLVAATVRIRILARLGIAGILRIHSARTSIYGPQPRSVQLSVGEVVLRLIRYSSV